MRALRYLALALLLVLPAARGSAQEPISIPQPPTTLEMAQEACDRLHDELGAELKRISSQARSGAGTEGSAPSSGSSQDVSEKRAESYQSQWLFWTRF